MTAYSIFETKNLAADEAVKKIIHASKEQNNRPFHLALSGGGSPPLIFDRLSQMAKNGTVDGSRFRLFWIDDRCVDIDNERSNAGLAKRHLGPFWQQAEIYAMDGTLPPQQAAAHYQAILNRFGGASAFDMALIGIGTDGHVASLFPGDSALDEQRLAAAAKAPDGEQRITVTFNVLAGCKNHLVLAWGAQKAPIVEQILLPSSPPESPISPFARACGKRSGVEVIMDQACASKLSEPLQLSPF